MSILDRILPWRRKRKRLNQLIQRIDQLESVHCDLLAMLKQVNERLIVNESVSELLEHQFSKKRANEAREDRH